MAVYANPEYLLITIDATDGGNSAPVPPLRIYGQKPGCEPTWRPVYRGDEAPVSINLLGADNNLYYNGQWHVTFRDDAECYPLTIESSEPGISAAVDRLCYGGAI